jgi:hypothetical protein
VEIKCFWGEKLDTYKKYLLGVVICLFMIIGLVIVINRESNHEGELTYTKKKLMEKILDGQELLQKDDLGEQPEFSFHVALNRAMQLHSSKDLKQLRDGLKDFDQELKVAEHSRTK